MDTILHHQTIETVRAQLLELHKECIVLARQLEDSTPLSKEKLDLACRWKAVMEQSFELQAELEQMSAASHAMVH